MKYDALQLAAAEASAELQKLVAEIEHLETRRILLLARRESLQIVGRHLVSVMSMISESTPADENVDMVAAPELPASEPAVHANALPEPEPEPVPVPLEEVSAGSAADTVPDAPPAKWPSLAELLAKSKPSTLRDEGWRAVPQATHLELRALARAEG